MNTMNEVEWQIDNLIENYSIDEIFDIFDLEGAEVIHVLFREGLIDPLLLEEVCGN